MGCGKNKLNCGKGINSNRPAYLVDKTINKEGTIISSSTGKKFRVVDPNKKR